VRVQVDDLNDELSRLAQFVPDQTLKDSALGLGKIAYIAADGFHAPSLDSHTGGST
jgi:hypothetical protein